jgi:hypothetical protein
MREVEINNAITKLYENVERCSVDDCWYFNIPLAIRLCKPLLSRRCWLVNAIESWWISQRILLPLARLP